MEGPQGLCPPGAPKSWRDQILPRRLMPIRLANKEDVVMNRCMMENRPRLLLVYADSAYASLAGRYFRRLGWEVRMVADGAEARRQFEDFQPTFVVIDTDLPDESGWLTCAKIMLDRPCARIIIQAPVRSEENL